MTNTVAPAEPNLGRISSDQAAMMRYDAEKRSMAIAYVLWFFLGGFGVHRFYLGRKGSGAVYLAIMLAGMVLSFANPILAVLFLVITVWWIVDLFLIPGMIRAYNHQVIDRLAARG